MICSRKERWLALAEILVIFAMFALQGAWPAPDVNEAHYLGKAAHYWNPDWIRGDFFLDTADSHKVFYFAFGWLTLLLPLPTVVWTGRIITWLLLAWSWRRLSFALLPRFGWAILTAGLFLVFNERLQMAGEWFIGGVEAKGFAYVLMLLGLESLLKSRWNRAWLMFGASAGFHVLVGGWAVVAAGFAWMFLRADRPKLASMLPGLVGGFLLSLPGLIPSLLLSRGIDAETAQTANVIYVFERLRHHLDVFQIRMDFVLRFAALTLGFLLLCRLINRFLAKRLTQAQADASVVARFQSARILQCFVAGSLAIALIGVVIDLVGLYDRTLAAGLLRFYWFRTADIVLPLGTALLATFWLELQLTAEIVRGAIALVTAIFARACHCEGILPLRMRSVPASIKEQLTVENIYAVIALVVAALTFVAAIVAISWHGQTYIPLRLHPVPARGDINMINAALITQPDQPAPSKAARLENLASWQDVCLWIRATTPTDARFFTPRLSQTFKWYARRAEVATWKDVPQDAASLVAWWNRIQDLFATGSPQPEFRWRENVIDMQPKELRAIAEKYQADYIVAPSGDAPPGWRMIYESKEPVTKKSKRYAVFHLERESGP